MSTFKASKIVKLINKALTHIHTSKSDQTSDSDELVLEKGNPWRDSLDRLAVEHKFNFDHISQNAEISNVVADLTKDVEAHKSADATQTTRAKPRAGDRTINDMKSWWKDSLSPADAEHRVAELPGKTRLLKRWFR